MKLMATDFDGTLFIDNKLSADTLLLIKKWQRAGNLFGIITGRDKLMITAKLRDYDLELDFFIGNNGAVIDDRLETPLSSADVREVVAGQFGSKADHLLLFTEKEHLVIINRKASKFYTRDYGQLKKITVEELGLVDSVAQLSFQFATNDEASVCAKQLNDHFGERLHAFPNNESVDVVRAGIDKAVGLSNYLLADPRVFEEIVVIGDGENDKELIQTFQGYSLEHASPVVKDLAKGIVGSVGELIELVMT